MKRRVVITGLGLVTPVGIGVEPTWQSLCQGKSGVGEITHFDASAYATQIAAEVKDFNPQDFMPKKDANRMEPFIAFALAACRMAMEDSGLVIDSSNESRVGTITGCGLGGLSFMEETVQTVYFKGPRRVSPFFYSHDDRQHGSRNDIDPFWCQRPELITCHGLRGRRTRGGKFGQTDPGRNR